MAKKANGRGSAKVTKEIVMHTIGGSNGGGVKKSRDKQRFERATKDAVQAISRGNLPVQDLAAALRQRLNMLHGPEWHCFVGRVKAFSVHVRYWRGKSFLFEDSGVKMLLFQSAPPALDQGGTVPGRRSKPDEGAEKEKRIDPSSSSITVLRSEMDNELQEQVLRIAASVAKGHKNGGDLDDLVSAIKVSLTELTGPVWHVVANRGGGEWGFSVAFEAGRLLDFKVHGDRFVVWKHAQEPPGLLDLFTTRRIAWAFFGTTVVLLGLYIKIQGSCDVCCSSHPERRAKARCLEGTGTDDGDAGDRSIVCLEGSRDEADRCLQNATLLFYLACAMLVVGTALRWRDRNSQQRANIDPEAKAR